MSNQQHADPNEMLRNMPDRHYFNSKLAERIERDGNGGFAVVCIDLDQFALINESMGSHFGDELICSVASRMFSVLREGDTLARLGGDEFAILVDGINQYQNAASLGERMLNLFAESFKVGGQDLEVTAGIGISIYPEDGTDVQTLLQNADYALCEAKGRGKNCFSSHIAASDTAALQQARMEYSLRKAIERDELVVQYQPLLDIRTGEIRCAEALVRWRHSNMGVIPPRQFIPLAEETGIIHTIGRFVRQTACRQCVEWLSDGLPTVAVSVNVSPVEFQKDGFPQDVVRTIKDSGIDARWFVLELTEAALLGDHDRIIDTLAELKASGISVSVDDFGVGYSSLSLLKDYPIDTIKIDRAFIKEIVSNSRNETIARAMVDMAHALDIAVVAEGVETVEQALLLQAMNCDMAQGYLFSRPVSPDSMATLLASGPMTVPGIESSADDLDYSIRESTG